MNEQGPRIKKPLASILGGLFVFLLVTWISNGVQAQNETTKTPPIDPQTDPLTKTQTRAENPSAGSSQQQPGRQQSGRQQPGKQMQRPVNPNAKPKVEIPNPEAIMLETKDGVRLACTYFPPPKIDSDEEKAVVPFILIHDWESDRRQLLNYASFLQHSGHAAIVPDLRGHGASTEVRGLSKPIDFEKFRKNEVMSALIDIERCKKFLVQQHNKKELNVDLLCVVAVGESSVLAVQWTLNDWFSFPPRNAQGVKQGQDVKALMLISPVKKIAGISMMNNLKHAMFSGGGGNGLPLLVMWSSTDEHAKDSESIANLLEKNRPDVEGIEDPAKRLEMTSFFNVPVRKYKFTGAQMIEAPRVERFWPYISNLLFEQKVVEKAKDYPWESREPKDEDDEDQ